MYIFLVLVVAMFTFSSLDLHKFYVSIYQVEHNISKKRLEITARIFIDDLNKELKRYSGQKTRVGETMQSTKDLEILASYTTEKFKISVNKKNKTLQFKSVEVLGDQVICYYAIAAVSTIKSIDVENTALFDIDSQQQNIINFNINKKRQSLILISNNPRGMLNF